MQLNVSAVKTFSFVLIKRCHKTPVERLSDFKLGMGAVIKADKDWRGVGPGLPASSCNASRLPRFLVDDSTNFSRQFCRGLQ